MDRNDVERIVQEYLNNQTVKYAIMIDGEWGSGKTYLYKNSFINIDNQEGKKWAYVSLYGVKSVNDVAKELLFQIMGEKYSPLLKGAGKTLSTVANVFTASVNAINIDLSKMTSKLSDIDIKNLIICFDDLERCEIPLNDILGYINRLIEHNDCKVIMLANQNQMKNFHGENEIRPEMIEKVIGFVITYTPEIDNIYESIIEEFKEDEIYGYLNKNKKLIVDCFNEQNCHNLRTFKFVLSLINGIYKKFIAENMEKEEWFETVMNSFARYIAFFMIEYKKGGNNSKLIIDELIDYIKVENKDKNEIRIKGYKFLEIYCTELNFLPEDFKKTVDILREEYERKQEWKRNSKEGLAGTLDDLENWRRKEDSEVVALCEQLEKEVEEDKYPHYQYPKIIGMLMDLDARGFRKNDIQKIVDNMKENIKKISEKINFNKYNYGFETEKDDEMQAAFENYIKEIQGASAKEEPQNDYDAVTKILQENDWALKLREYCAQEKQWFIWWHSVTRYLDIELLKNRLKNASTNELYIIAETFRKAYDVKDSGNIYSDDLETLKSLLKSVESIDAGNGINKPHAKKLLEECLNEIITGLGEGGENVPIIPVGYN